MLTTIRRGGDEYPLDKPDCQCFNDPQMRAEREGIIDAIGQGVMHTVRMNADQFAICVPALPYLCGSALAALALLASQAKVLDRPTTIPEQLAALEAIVAHALDRLNGARAKDLDAMTPMGGKH